MLKNNEKVILIEKNSKLGGVSTLGGFNTWEGGFSDKGVHFKLAKYLLENKKGGIGKTIGKVCKETPYHYSKIFENERYEDTLKRGEIIKRFHFEAEDMSKIMLHLLRIYPNLTIMFDTEFKDVTVKNNKIESVIVKHNIDEQVYEIKAKYFSDCTGDIVLARKAGCAYTIGEEGYDEYKEPSAPKKASNYVKGVSQVIRITKTKTKRVYKMPMEYINENTRKWMENIYTYKQVPKINEYPNKDLNINLPSTMNGSEYMLLHKDDRQYYLHSRMYAYFEFLTKQMGFDTYKIAYIFPQVGVRETYRLKGQYILTENDILNSTFKKDVLCYGDYPIDIHEKMIKLKEPYGIPKECILTNEYKNLVVASRGSSFSHIAASFCSIPRTMIALGEGSGKILFSMFKSII